MMSPKMEMTRPLSSRSFMAPLSAKALWRKVPLHGEEANARSVAGGWRNPHRRLHALH